jgi:hypothetical protein
MRTQADSLHRQQSLEAAYLAGFFSLESDMAVSVSSSGVLAMVTQVLIIKNAGG